MRPVTIVLVFLALALLLSPKPYEASRILHEETQEWMKKKNLSLQSRAKGPVPSSEPNPPKRTSKSNNQVSTTSQKSFVVHAMPPQPVNPHKMVPFGRVTKP
ncbi:hypothetical protein Acr_13g0002620 [Actinidia rufa]|uniref:Uncharacterized protein n=1 Tax=Actinidia rufa TaxID=165716 RepID=A0A7J0FJI9_9ERIC|nr:hypothetical protein Acr_13g0002300 [Actinidia rufa]GFY98861.1 hypothetical protein Acr_13g0002620 [Actinidia rufa]